MFREVMRRLVEYLIAQSILHENRAPQVSFVIVLGSQPALVDERMVTSLLLEKDRRRVGPTLNRSLSSRKCLALRPSASKLRHKPVIANSPDGNSHGCSEDTA